VVDRRAVRPSSKSHCDQVCDRCRGRCTDRYRFDSNVPTSSLSEKPLPKITVGKIFRARSLHLGGKALKGMMRDATYFMRRLTLVAFIASGLWFYCRVTVLRSEIETLKRRILAAEFGVRSLKERVNDWEVLLSASGF
jgi:hypothetical protein